MTHDQDARNARAVRDQIIAAQEQKAHPLDVQIGGGHYKDMKIQPVEYILANAIPFVEGSVIKYVSRWRSKGGVEDLRKARHFLDMLIEYEEGLK